MAREIAAVEKLDDRGAVQRITEVLSKSAKGRRIAEDGGEPEEVQAPDCTQIPNKGMPGLRAGHFLSAAR